MPFDIEAARKAGYSDEEIIGYLTQTRKFDVAGARDAGYSNDEIIGHLSGATTQQPTAPTPEYRGVSEQFEAPDPFASVGTAGQVAEAAGKVASVPLIPLSWGKQLLGYGMRRAGGPLIEPFAITGVPEAYPTGVAPQVAPTNVGTFREHQVGEYPRPDIQTTLADVVPQLAEALVIPKYLSWGGKTVGRFADIGAGALSKVPGLRMQTLTGLEGLNAEAYNIVKSGFQRHIKPPVSQVRTAQEAEKYYSQATVASEDIIRNKQSIGLVDRNGVARLPESVEDQSLAMSKGMENNFETWGPLIEKSEAGGGRISTAPAVAELKKAASDPVMIDKNPGAAKYAADLAKKLEERVSYSPAEAQRFITDANRALNAYYRSASPQELANAAIDATVANHLRRGLDEAVSSFTGEGLQPLKNIYKAYKEVQPDVAHRAGVWGRRAPRNIWDFSDFYTGIQIVDAVVNGGTALAKGAISFSIKKIGQRMVNPDVGIAKMFRDLEPVVKKKIALGETWPPTKGGAGFPLGSPVGQMSYDYSEKLKGVSGYPDFPQQPLSQPYPPGRGPSASWMERTTWSSPEENAARLAAEANAAERLAEWRRTQGGSELGTPTYGGQAPRPGQMRPDVNVSPPAWQAPQLVTRPQPTPPYAKTGQPLLTPEQEMIQALRPGATQPDVNIGPPPWQAPEIVSQVKPQNAPVVRIGNRRYWVREDGELIPF